MSAIEKRSQENVTFKVNLGNFVPWGRSDAVHLQ